MLTELPFRASACQLIRQNLFYTIVPFSKRSVLKPLYMAPPLVAEEKMSLARSLHCDFSALKLCTGYGITMQAAEKPYVPARVLFSWVFIVSPSSQ